MQHNCSLYFLKCIGAVKSTHQIIVAIGYEILKYMKQTVQRVRVTSGSTLLLTAARKS